MSTLRTAIDRFTFRGAQMVPATASRDSGPWTKADTSAAGAPTVQAVGGAMELTLAADNEVENICLYTGDILGYDIDDLIRVEFLAKMTASFPAACTAVLGLASARNDTPDSVTANAWFRLQGDNNLLVETDDGTNDNDDVATGLTLSTTYRRLAIDFRTGIHSQSPPSRSLGAKSNVQFFAGNANNSLRRVAAGTRFDMSNYSSGLQVLAQLQKTAAASVATLSIAEITVEYRLPA